MSIETSLYSTLSNDSGVTSLVSTRIYPGNAPDSVTRPYVVYSTISTERLHTLPGVGNMQRKTIQFDCNADTYAAAKGLANAVISALEGDGYQQSEYDLYDDATEVHTVFVIWDFMA